jgi:N-glycosylase/DNA lyase
VTTRGGVAGNEVDGVFFTEASSIPGAEDLGELKVKINGQNKDLRAVKTELARRVKSKGGNGLVAFTYGQRGNAWWQSFGAVDAEHWYGNGRAVRIVG